MPTEPDRDEGSGAGLGIADMVVLLAEDHPVSVARAGGRDQQTGRPTHLLAIEREVRRRRGRPLADGTGRCDPVDPAIVALAPELFG